MYSAMCAMDFWQETNCFAIQTKPFLEKLAAAGVAKLNVEIFLPRIGPEQDVCGTFRTVCKALFAGYFFARFCPLLSLDALRYTLGVLRVVGNARIPTPLAPEIIESIRTQVQSYGTIWLQPRPLQPAEKVEIDRGPFAGWMAEVEQEWDDGRRVAILLGALRQARMLIQRRWLQPIEAV